MICAYITNRGDNSISLIDTDTNVLEGTISGLQPSPLGITTSPDGQFVYITNLSDDSVSKIDTTNDHNVIWTVPVGDAPWGIDITPDGAKLYVGNSADQSITVLDAATGATITTIAAIGGNAFGVAVTPNGLFTYVNTDNNRIVVIDNTTDTIFTTIVSGLLGPLMGIVIDSTGTFAYVTRVSSQTVRRITIATNTISGTVLAGNNTLGIAITPDDNFLYVANNGDGTVSVIDTTTFTVVDTITVGSSPFGVDVTPDGTQVYVANGTDNTVSVIEVATGNVTATVPVGSQPAAFGTFITLCCPLITLSPTDLPAVGVGGFYNESVTASGGLAPYVYTITAGSLPPGLTLNPANGQISGNAGGLGPFNFTITATDAEGCMGSEDYTITVTPFSPGGPVSKGFTPSSVPAGTISTLTISIANTGNTTLTGITFNDIFPAGLEVAPVPNLTNDMGGIASFTATSLSLIGGSIPAFSTGTITIDVISNTAGTYNNDTGVVVSNLGNLGSSTASLTVTAAPSPTPKKKGRSGGGVAASYYICIPKRLFDQGLPTKIFIERSGMFYAYSEDNINYCFTNLPLVSPNYITQRIDIRQGWALAWVDNKWIVTNSPK